MGFLSKLFRKKEFDNKLSNIPNKSSDKDPASDPNMIKVFDEYGREMFIAKQQWRDNLLGNLEKKQDSPDELYNMLVGALHDGFAADVIPYAEYLHKTDTIPSRSAIILGVAYMEVNRLDDAQRVFEEFISKHGEEGVLLTNLAKVYNRRGNKQFAESTLWHALELNPNQDNGLGWYAAIHHERGGKSASLDAYRRVAALPKSWRARLWLARNALEHKDLSSAESLYQEALSISERPVPTDLLMQMSGDLGNNGYLSEAVRLSEPYFDPKFHGLKVGNNIIKANIDLGQTEEARRILNQLYVQKRPDWRQTLSFWDTELAKAGIAAQEQTSSGQLLVSLISIEGPLWSRDNSPFAAILPVKCSETPHIAILGSTALRPHAPVQPELQLSDGPGRLSRAIPLFLAEHIHLASNAVGLALIPWIQDKGFALFGYPYNAQDLCVYAEKSEEAPDYVVSIILDTTKPIWNIMLRLLRREDRNCLGETTVKAASDNPGLAVEQLTKILLKMLTSHSIAHKTPAPRWYQPPSGRYASDYLLRLEQQLAVALRNLDDMKGGGLSGEREVLDGCLWLCTSLPDNLTVRMVFAHTLRQMKKARPDILREYQEKVNLLQTKHPIVGDISQLIEKTIAEVFES